MGQFTHDAGELRHRVKLEQLVETPDGCGGFTSNWQLVRELWAAIEPQSNTQFVAAGNLNTNCSHKFTTRWNSDCKPEMRFVKGARTFVINGLCDPDESKRYLICQCEEAK